MDSEKQLLLIRKTPSSGRARIVMRRASILIAAFGWFNSGYSATLAHEENLDGLGCHQHRESNEYYCHQGPLAGRSFSSKDVARSALGMQSQAFIDGITVEGSVWKGEAEVIDGDTLKIKDTYFNLYGIDAPELDQTCEWPKKTIPCGDMARAAVLELITLSDEIKCEGVGHDRQGRLLVTCFALDGLDIGREMVYTGWALAYREYSGKYLPAEWDAKENKRGVWKGEFVPPWEWRRGKLSDDGGN